MSTKSSRGLEAVEEYAPGPGHPDTLDGYRDWCVWRDREESGKRERIRLASLVGGEK